MQLHTLKKVSTEKHAQRVGRGGKRGTTSGRGTKGQRSRSGRRIRPAIRDLVQRTPKRRGFRNKPKSEKPFVVSIADLVVRAKPLLRAGKVEITRDTLLAMSLIPKGYQGDIKILGNQEITQVFTIRGVAVSQAVKERVEKAGGTIL